MRRLIGFLAVSALILGAASTASAQRYRILDGELQDAGSGARGGLEGELEFGVSSLPDFFLPGLGVDRFHIAGFALASGDQSYSPAVYHALDGLTAGSLILRLPDSLDLLGDRVDHMLLAAGGQVAASSEDSVTFRNHAFIANGGEALDREASGGGLPVRFSATGALTTTETTYTIQRNACEPIVIIPSPPINPPSPGPLPGGGVITIGGSGGLEISAGTVTAVNPGGLVLSSGSDLRNGVTLTLATAREPDVISLAGLPPGDATLTSVGGGTAVSVELTLEDLGITAPDGATITIEPNGHVTVESDGDIEIDAGELDIEGLTRLIIVSATRITVGPAGIALADGVELELRSGDLYLNGPLDVTPRDVEIVAGTAIIIGTPFCPGLRFAGSEVVSMQSFELLAAVELPVDVRLLSNPRNRRSHPSRRRVVSLAILGSQELDVRDVDVRSLRLGSEAARALRRALRRDVNRDGIQDLVVRFAGSGVAAADGEACVTGATFDGPAIAGCAALAVASPAAKANPKADPKAKAKGRRR